jgi:hypothetical protein
MEAGFLVQNFVPLMFAGLFVFLLSGIPVAFGLAATGLMFGYIGMEAGLFNSNLFQALPLRIFGIMQNDTLLAIPFFTFMGIILERSGMAEDLLETVGQVFGPLRGGCGHCRDSGGCAAGRHHRRGGCCGDFHGLISLPDHAALWLQPNHCNRHHHGLRHLGAGHSPIAGADCAG